MLNVLRHSMNAPAWYGLALLVQLFLVIAAASPCSSTVRVGAIDTSELFSFFKQDSDEFESSDPLGHDSLRTDKLEFVLSHPPIGRVLTTASSSGCRMREDLHCARGPPQSTPGFA